MNNDDELEERIRQKGLEIYSSLPGVPAAFDTARWMGRIMKWAMNNDAFRTRLFRFIDLLPSLTNDELAVRMLGEYFGTGDDVPRLIRAGVGRISRKGFLPHLTARVVRSGVRTIARQFIAGRDAADSAAALNSLRLNSIGFSIDLLGEEILSEKEAGEYRTKYLDLIGFLESRSGPQTSDGTAVPDISIKVSSFYSQIDPIDWDGSIERTKEALRPVIRKARDSGISVTFDMEHHYLKDLIIAVFKSLLGEPEFADGPFASIAIQAYLRESEKDLMDLTDWAGKQGRKVGVRLVKGAYWDYEMVVSRRKNWPVPVFTEKEETDLSFEKLTRKLFERASVIRPAIATHNLRSLSKALALAETMNLAADAFEFQMLYGMAEPMVKALNKMGEKIRIYTPLGDLIPGMAYLVRRLLENTSNASFLRKSFAEKSSFEELIRPPLIHKMAGMPPKDDNVFRNEPPLDFSLRENRRTMFDALAEAKRSFGTKYPLYIKGEELFVASEIKSLNPAEEAEVVGRVCQAGVREAAIAVEAARKAWPAWRKTDAEERAAYLFDAAKEMRKRRVELAALEIYEAGKTWKEADGDVTEAIDYLEYYGREMIRLGRPSRLGDYPGEENEYVYRAKGIGVVISPWNFPLAIPTGMVSAGLVTGNCIILKPSGLTPVLASKIVEIFSSTGLPPGVLQFVPGPGGEIGEYLVSHPDMDFVVFTGSKDVGLRIVEIAGKPHVDRRNMEKIVAEMGGKNAVIIDETADLVAAVKGVIESAFGYQGQKCSACSRVIVVGGIFDEFCKRLKEAAEDIRIGSPENPGIFLGPLIDKEAIRKVGRYIETARREGKLLVKVAAGRAGNYLGPVIFTDVSPDASTAREEIFGPVLALFHVEKIDEAIALANHTEYALTGGIYTRTPSAILKVKDELRAGNIYINRKITGALVGRQPFGGYGMSGVGSKAGGPDYLLQFLNPVCASEDTMRRGFAPGGKNKP